MKTTKFHANQRYPDRLQNRENQLFFRNSNILYAKARSTLLLAIFAAALVSCGGGTTESVNQQIQDDSSPSIDEPQNPLPQIPTIISGEATTNTNFPFSGTFTVDEFIPSVISSEYLGIIEITPSPLSKNRLLDGSLARRLSDGRIVYRQPCGQGAHRIMIADQNLRLTQITPCSSEVPNEGASATDFEQSTLSPDGTHIAVEARYFLNSGYNYATLVFNINSQQVIATWEGAYAGTWMPDGRLLLASSDGLFVLDEAFDNPTRHGTEITTAVNNPAVSPDGASIAFEYNQQIWGMSIDGTDARQLLFGGARLRYPTWAPDGTATLAYLALPSRENYHSIIYVADLVNGQAYALNLDPVLEFSIDSLRTIKGPISWSQ